MSAHAAQPGTLVLASCSRRKTACTAAVPALERYVGGIAPHLRARFGHHADLRSRILFLSARHGLIDANTPLCSYDQRLTTERADELRPRVHRALLRRLDGIAVPTRLLVVAEPLYLGLLADLLAAEDRPTLRWVPDPRGWYTAASVLDEWNWP
ncbi:hypothetical protein [Streptomyces sp. NPDC048172]|uniref:hypothetical protein n=1 Tax=Streptomyces sp. NPDC048172 TaxID=3365505 RepID=UPI003713C0FC